VGDDNGQIELDSGGFVPGRGFLCGAGFSSNAARLTTILRPIIYIGGTACMGILISQLNAAL
jgi:hypothetical protein